ncbi:MAG: type II toxin-antitoxin system VapC family toxin [Propionibacteriaceae bacterium]|jgi:predicted nucleic acid-binding protein|nr:type II toxin-antitoxin system VapC family toxin [Propionibacteriaceae bacterium]
MAFLVDTNVLSELRKSAARRNAGVARWAADVAASKVFISVISVAELSCWVAKVERRDAAQGEILRNWFEGTILAEAAGKILALDIGSAARAGALHVPDPRDYRDAFIAATALEHALTVVTRNVADFEPMGVRLVNPFE